MHSNHATRVITALLVVAVSIPLTTQALFRSIDDEGVWVFEMEDIRPSVRAQRAEQALKHRLFYRAMEMYRDFLRQPAVSFDRNPYFDERALPTYLDVLNADELALYRPDINNIDSIMRYLDADLFNEFLEEIVLTHSAASEVSHLTINELPYKERQLMRWYRQTGYRCPNSLRNSYLSGLYELCIRLTTAVGRDIDSSVLRDDAYFRGVQFSNSAPQRSIKRRLRMMEEARTGSAGRRANAEINSTRRGPYRAGFPPMENLDEY